jgi:hypothetical protein
LLRGFAKFLAVVALAGAGGTALGFGLSALGGNDGGSTPAPVATGATTSNTGPSGAPKTASTPASTATATQATTTPAPPTRTITTTTAPALTRPPAQTSGGKLRVDVISTIVHPVTGDTNQRAEMIVHVRVTNGTGRLVQGVPPVLRVGDAVVQSTADRPETAPLLAVLGPGAVADGKLRFITTGADSGQLTAGRVRLRIASKSVVLTPEIGSSASG